jgi:hypothetical protein
MLPIESAPVVTGVDAMVTTRSKEREPKVDRSRKGEPLPKVNTPEEPVTAEENEE